MVSGAVEKRQTLPVLANLLMKVEKDSLVVTATDLEIEISVNIPLEGEYSEGSLTVPARKLIDICKSFSSDSQITIEQQEDRIKVACGRSRFSLSTIPAQEFPNIDETISKTKININSLILKGIFDKTQFAMAQQDVRYYLNGMLLELNKNSLFSVATDGHRLALSKILLEQNFDELTQAIIPRKGILEVSKILSSLDDVCLLELSNNHIKITLGQFTFISKLIDGRFPDYEKVLPKNATRSMVCEKEKLRDAFSRASILCNEKFRGVRLTLETNKLIIHANNPDQEEAEIELDVDYTDESMEIGFNVSYLLDALNTIKSQSVRFNFGDTSSSLLIESTESDDSVYVVMPMRL